MHRSAVRRAMTAATAVVTTTLATLSGLAAPAQAEVSTDGAASHVKIVKTSGLYGDGAVVIVDVRFTCDADTLDSWVYVRVTQVDGPFGTVSGEGGAGVTCTGAEETVPVAVPGYATFQTGEAFASADLNICGDFECTTVESSREVKVRAGTREVRSYRSHDLSYRLPKTGEIQAGGAGAVVLVPYTCAADLYGNFEAALAQATTDGFVNTSGDATELRCTESSRNGVLAFHANGTGWVAGNAFILVNGITCDDGVGICTNGTTYRSIKLA